MPNVFMNLNYIPLKKGLLGCCSALYGLNDVHNSTNSSLPGKSKFIPFSTSQILGSDVLSLKRCSEYVS